MRREVVADPDTPAADVSVAGTDRLMTALYDELRTIARREHFRAGSPQTLQPTALVSEAYLKLANRDGWESRTHFLGHAATAIRHVLIDAARARMAAKRGTHVFADTQALDRLTMVEDDELVRLGDALKALSALDANLAKVVDCRFFAGLDESETAAVLLVSDRTVRRWWTQARAWIYREMECG